MPSTPTEAPDLERFYDIWPRMRDLEAAAARLIKPIKIPKPGHPPVSLATVTKAWYEESPVPLHPDAMAALMVRLNAKFEKIT